MRGDITGTIPRSALISAAENAPSTPGAFRTSSRFTERTIPWAASARTTIIVAAPGTSTSAVKQPRPEAYLIGGPTLACRSSMTGLDLLAAVRSATGTVTAHLQQIWERGGPRRGVR